VSITDQLADSVLFTVRVVPDCSKPGVQVCEAAHAKVLPITEILLIDRTSIIMALDECSERNVIPCPRKLTFQREIAYFWHGLTDKGLLQRLKMSLKVARSRDSTVNSTIVVHIVIICAVRGTVTVKFGSVKICTIHVQAAV
jgi:hypothetical protein